MNSDAYRDSYAAAIELIEAQKGTIGRLRVENEGLRSADRLADRKQRRYHRLFVMFMTLASLGCVLGILLCVGRIVGVVDAGVARMNEVNFCEIEYDEPYGYYVRGYAFGAREPTTTLGRASLPDEAVDMAAVLGCPLHVTGPRPTCYTEGTEQP